MRENLAITTTVYTVENVAFGTSTMTVKWLHSRYPSEPTPTVERSVTRAIKSPAGSSKSCDAIRH